MGIEPLDIPVPGGTLRALRFTPDGAGADGSGGTGRQILAAHGITASAMSFATVARQLPPGWTLTAVDLRGRGGSEPGPGPFGMSRHAGDLCTVAEHLGTPIVLTGHSMGGYAALRAAALRPDLFSRLVLLDGGLPLPVPDEFDPDQVLEATVGPAVARLRQTFASEDAYVDFFRVHPALAGDWNDDIDAYVRYDATGEPGAVRSRVSADAVYADGRDLLVDGASFGRDLAALAVPATLLYAPAGMFGQPPGLLPQPLVEHWAAQAPRLRVELVPDTNHYTILMTDRPAARIAGVLTG